MALSDTRLRTLKATRSTYKVYDVGGLYLEVSYTGNRLWRYRYRAGGKDKRLALWSRHAHVDAASAARCYDRAVNFPCSG